MGCCLAWTMRTLGTLFPATLGEGPSLPAFWFPVRKPVTQSPVFMWRSSPEL